MNILKSLRLNSTLIYEVCAEGTLGFKRILRNRGLGRVGSSSLAKIFGIGLGKTGTTSLHFALELLGFRSAHASSVLSDVINHEAQNHRPLLSTLEEQYDAFIDWPISHLYRQLDYRFPGSKFILTLRDPVARYRSAARHIQEDQSRRDRGLSYAWTHLVAEAPFKAEDEFHTSSVLSYFSNREKDLLVMRITEGTGWGELCNFLRTPVPDMPFPHHKAHGSHEAHFLRLSPVEPRVVCANLDHGTRSSYLERCRTCLKSWLKQSEAA